MEDQQRHGAPHLALEMEDAVRDLVADRTDRPVDLARLAAGMAKGARQPRPAIEAQAAATPVAGLPRAGFQGAGADRSRHDIADRG